MQRFSGAKPAPSAARRRHADHSSRLNLKIGDQVLEGAHDPAWLTPRFSSSLARRIPAGARDIAYLGCLCFTFDPRGYAATEPRRLEATRSGRLRCINRQGIRRFKCADQKSLGERSCLEDMHEVFQVSLRAELYPAIQCEHLKIVTVRPMAGRRRHAEPTIAPTGVPTLNDGVQAEDVFDIQSASDPCRELMQGAWNIPHHPVHGRLFPRRIRIFDHQGVADDV